MENNTFQDILTIYDQKTTERFNKMAAAFAELKSSVAKYAVMPHSSEITNELDAAHSKCLAKLKCVARQSKGNRSIYAKIEHVAEYANPILSEFGLSIKQILSYNEHGHDILITRFSHASGQWVESRILLKEEQQSQSANQKFGSSITYARRYAFLAILGIGAIDDPTDTIE
jgi:hypothetical protein